MLYTVDMELEVDVQDAFDNLTQKERRGLIEENITYASNESLRREIQSRKLKIAEDANYQELVNRASALFLDGGMAAHDFMADSLGLQCTVSVDAIINKLKSVLQ